MKHQILAYALARIALGVNLLAHGLVRIPKTHTFQNWMVSYFEGTLLPSWLVLPFAVILPFLEFTLGLLLLLGLFTRHTLVAVTVLLMILMLGSCLKESWETVGIQLIYILFTLILLFHLDLDVWGIRSVSRR